MPDKIGRFELVSQLAQSAVATIHKALDTETQQTVALKAVQLSAVKVGAALLKSVLEESEQAKPLNSHNIAVLYGVGEEDGQLLAATEYVQGNSIATTLARHEGFSIWDLQDVARQVCHALDHAQGHKVIHQSLEPAKIMVQWDGQVKVLGFGISAMSAHAAEISEAVPELLHYASPEQLRGETCDHRSALFSLGAVLYEMATEQKAFPGETAEQVRQAIVENQPPLPVRLKPNVNPGLSKLIMKALSKSPDERYQSGQELVHDLEQCKSSANTLPAAAVPTPQKPKAQAAAAGAGPSSTGLSSGPPSSAGTISTSPTSTPKSISSGDSLPGSLPSHRLPRTTASSTPVEEPKPSFAVDPMMAEDDDSPAAAFRKSFSEMSELPPLKEVYVAPPPPAAEEPEASEPLPLVVFKKGQPEKPSIQVREAAEKAVTAIRRTPPKLYLYAMGGAAVIIALIVGVMALSNYWQDRDSGGTSAAPATTVTQTSPAPQNAQPPAPEPQSQAEAVQPEPAQPETTRTEAAAPPSELPARSGRGKKTKSRAGSAAVPAQLTVSSNPAGAQIAFDGSPLCVTPCTLTGIAPGQHMVSASKSGYGAESRTIALSSGANSSIAIDLNPLSAKLTVASTPAGAVILIDGKDSGKLSPSQFMLDKPGTHTVVLRRHGYLDETSTVNAEAGQTANVNLVLKPLGSTDEIRGAGGKFKKVFGGSDTASMGIVSIKTQPKGAQIMVNNRVLDKTSPFDFYLNPGTYVIDITMSGYRTLHRVIVVGEREKVAIEEALSPE